MATLTSALFLLTTPAARAAHWVFHVTGTDTSKVNGVSHNPAWTPPNDTPYGVTIGQWYVGGGTAMASTTAKADLALTIVGTWTADPTDPYPIPPPTYVVVNETSTAGAGGSNGLNQTCSGTADDGCGQSGSGSVSTPTGGVYVAYQVQNGKFEVDPHPTASITSQPNPSYFSGWPYFQFIVGTSSAGAGVGPLTLSTLPVAINLTGPATDSHGNLILDGSGNAQILVGQQCTASLSGLPSVSGATTTYAWSVSGTTFQTWSATTPALPPALANPNASYYVGGPGILTNPTASWYWNNMAANGPVTETVSCTATVTPPAGQGSAFTVTATKNVAVYWPLWKCTGTGGAIYVNTSNNIRVNSPAYPNDGGYWLYAGPTTGSGETGGMDWNASVLPPLSVFAAGSLQMVQLIIPGMSFRSTGGDTYNWSTNGQEGLDTAYPYGWSRGAPDYFSGDSPGIPLSQPLVNTVAYSATLQDQFEDYLLYFAPGSSQGVPVARFVWSTSGSATIPSSGSTLDWSFWAGGTAGTIMPSGGLTKFLPNNSFPMWTQNNATTSGGWMRQ